MSSSLGNEHNNALNDDKLTYNNGLHTFDQQQQQQNRRSENRDDVDGGGEPDDHGDEDRMEQLEDEDLLFPPSLVCWSRPTQTARKCGDPSFPTSTTSNSHSSADCGEDDERQQQGGENMFEQIAKLAGLDSLENGANSNGTFNGQCERKELTQSCNDDDNDDDGVELKNSNNWTPSSSSARRKSFNPMRIKEDPPMENCAAAEAEDSSVKHHSHVFIKRLDEGEEGADDEQMGPVQQQGAKMDLFMDSNHSGVSTSPLNPFAYFPPPLFPLEADEEESGGQHRKEDATLQKQQQPNLGYFARFLKNELAGACAGAVDKVVGDFSTSSSSSCSNRSSADNVDEQYTQQQHQTAAVQHQQHLQAVHATRLWTAALALAATRQQQQHLTTEQQALAAAQIGACRTQMPPFSLSSTTTMPPPTSRGMPTTPASAFPWFSVPSMSMNAAAAAALYTTAQQHPLISTAIGAFLANAVQSATSSASVRGGGGGGIFPPPPVPHPSSVPAAHTLADQQNLNSSGCSTFSMPNFASSQNNGLQLQHNYPLRMGLRSSADCDDSPRKKRAKVTDCVRGPRSSLHREFAAFPANTPRTTPANAAATVPTMVPSVEPHARLLAYRCTGKSPIDGGAGGRTEVSSGDELAVPISPHRTTLTHMHLRKAKLMFFYQRYPSSSLLKSYFPDVHFTKHNTAQLVKWFSNFREFFYMQMEKFAKQALAEGVKRADEIYVSTESEVFKQLQQHYNKNNAFQAPERLLLVIEETLREFFNALKQGRDVEPSWKKAIYKVIQQLDEPIPEFFREPQFVELLEQN
uniref:Prospero domain-containing protein n=1 Tax=Globodera rostochiensis TaxID=31243 RepID=A0A914IBD4_GLORO